MRTILKAKNNARLIENAEKRIKQLKNLIFYDCNPNNVQRYQNEIALNVMKIDKWKRGE